MYGEDAERPQKPLEPGKVRTMHSDDLKVLLRDAGEWGAREALSQIGMSSHDPMEREKIHREFLDARALGVGVRSAKEDVLREVRRWLVRAAVVAIIGGIALKLGVRIPSLDQ